jgi:hypothetical protein
MEMTKEELQRKVKELTAAITMFNNDAEMLQKDLADAEQRLAVVDRPKVTKKFLDELSDAVEEAIGNIDFTDCNAYDYEFNLDYDNRISLENIEFNHAHDIGDEIYSKLEDLFNIIEDEDEA